jgi:hypothetical protein
MLGRGAAALTALVLLGGCTVTLDSDSSAPRQRSTEQQEQWTREQRIELDLASPLTREDAGFTPTGRTTVLERRPPGHLDVRLLLPEGDELRLPAVSLVIDALMTEQPNSLSVARLEPWREGAEALVQTVERFGMDSAVLEEFLQTSAQSASDVNRSFGTVELGGYLRFSVEARQIRSDDLLQLNYRFTWDAEPAEDPFGLRGGDAGADGQTTRG